MALTLLRTPGTRFYVATAWEQRAARDALRQALTARGLVDSGDDGGHQPPDDDVAAVREAQVLVVLMTLPHCTYAGAFVELGIALGAGIPVLLVSPFTAVVEAACARVKYFHHPAVQAARVASVQDLLAALAAAPGAQSSPRLDGEA